MEPVDDSVLLVFYLIHPAYTANWRLLNGYPRTKKGYYSTKMTTIESKISR